MQRALQPSGLKPCSLEASWAAERDILEDLGNLGDFIGGIAVVVTIIYLAVQVRRNTRALQTASRQELVSGFREHNRLFFEAGATDAFSAGLRRYPDIPREQADLFSGMLTDHATFLQGAFALHEAGTLEDETYEAYLQYFSATVLTPGGAAWWSEIGPLFTPRMVRAVNARIERGELPDLLALDTFADPNSP